jgi:hypothetical protein
MEPDHGSAATRTPLTTHHMPLDKLRENGYALECLWGARFVVLLSPPQR